MLLAAIITAEVLFWVFLLGGLSVRYLLGWKKVSIVMLALTPVIDLILIGFTYYDLSHDGKSHFIHGLSAFYVGYSITLGPSIIGEMDRKFAARFGGGVPTEKSDPTYREHVTIWKKVIAATAITLLLLAVGLFLVGIKGSFWIIYWMITAVFVVIAWWFIGPYRSLRKERRSATRNPQFE
ncbi:hypothetical protein [Corynebacterium sanguinis]|uniref:hypothetical protein n=1 Tax=Corynebacterium sanguinis TaxID=2594913 RepID=UPI0021A6E0F1|nr:hypothetical protein [Corynebacterium sanguinis]MCT1412988.1 hypothetical protein [Corynebacterium sanguinis]